jgi:hypothetical protein
VKKVFETPKWRNWQTHWIQGPALARACGFKSRLRHQYTLNTYNPNSFPFASMISID